MTTSIIDRRHSAKPGPDPEAETERMRRRRAVRESAARRDIELRPALLAEKDVRDSEARCDELADSHQRVCQPWQNELTELEELAVKRIGAREPPNTEEDARRGELARLIAAATADLEKAVADEAAIQSIARRKARKTREGKPPSDTILMALAKPPLANPALLGEQFVRGEQLKWLKARQQAAEKTLKICQYNLNEIRAKRMSGDVAVWQGKVSSWEAEVGAVGNEITIALAESDKAYREMIEE